MLAIQKSKSHKGKCSPNVLPCRVHHNGAVNASTRYWEPKTSAGKTIAYFRGRKLYGKKLAVPVGYRGVVLSSTDRILPKPLPTEEDDADEFEEVKVVEEQGEFEDIMIWGHESLPDEIADPYIRGVEEWVGFAEMVHSAEDHEEKDGVEISK